MKDKNYLLQVQRHGIAEGFVKLLSSVRVIQLRFLLLFLNLLKLFKSLCEELREVKQMISRGIFIGRFQPFHLGHLVTVKYALEKVDELVVVIGSAQISHESRNPFTAGERIQMIKSSLDADDKIDSKRILIIPVPDVNTHYLWTYQLDMMVPPYQTVFSNDSFTRVLYKERGTEVIQTILYKRKELSGTKIRYRMALDKVWENLVPIQTARVIQDIAGTLRVKAIRKYSKSDH